MSADDDRIVLEDQTERPAAKIGTLIAAAVTVIAAMALLGSVGSPVDVPSDSLPDITAPPQQPLAIMPDLVGRDLIEVVDLLRDAGLDSTIVSQARWLANPEVPAGAAYLQSPPAGTEVFDINVVTLVMSAGGPVISWDDVPIDLQELIATQYTPDRSEPVLVVETGSGRVYKTDALLFGPCNAVELAQNAFYDRVFDGLCKVGPPETIVGWTPNGGMFAIEGLPRQGHKSSSALLQLDEQFWDIQSVVGSVRRLPAVTIEANGIRIVGGYDEYFVWTAGQVELASQLSSLIEPIDIRGNLVLNLTEPLTFGHPGLVESDFGSALVRFDNADVIASETESSITISPAFIDSTEVTTLIPSTWQRVDSADTEWQHALPGVWQSGQLSERELVSATTFAPTATGERCGLYPVGLLRQVGPTDALVYVAHGSSLDFRVWLEHFDPEDVGPVSALDPDLDCLEGLDAEIRTSSRFYDGRSLDIVIGFGPDIDRETRQQAFAILDSLEPLPDYLDNR